jgi:hypothetical protein
MLIGSRPGSAAPSARGFGGSYCGEDAKRYFRDDRVAKGSEAVHPAGNPISHSTHSGFGKPVPERPATISRSHTFWRSETW